MGTFPDDFKFEVVMGTFPDDFKFEVVMGTFPADSNLRLLWELFQLTQICGCYGNFS